MYLRDLAHVSVLKALTPEPVQMQPTGLACAMTDARILTMELNVKATTYEHNWLWSDSPLV